MLKNKFFSILLTLLREKRLGGRLCISAITMVWLVQFLTPVSFGAELTLAIQPILSKSDTEKRFQPLRSFLAEATGKTVALKTSDDFLQYWIAMQKAERHSLALDSAIFTDYRIKRAGFTPLVKVEGLTSYSLVTLPSLAYFKALELVGKKVATPSLPSPSSLVLFRMFPKATRLPVAVSVKNAAEALGLLRAGKVQAAMVSTPATTRAREAGVYLSVIEASEQFPHITLSAASTVDVATRNIISSALLNAQHTSEGRTMLKRLGFTAFEEATPEIYDGYSEYLQEGWLQ